MRAHRDTPLWTPSAERIASARITAFTGWIEDQQGIEFADYGELWQWSVDDVGRFWSMLWRYFDVPADGTPEPALATAEMPGAQWFPNVAVNYAEALFRGRADDTVALHHADETRPSGTWTWRRLHDEVARIADGLRRLGVRRGDRVAAYLPNLPETLAAFLATASLGAVWSSAAPEFGERSVVDRFAQIAPRVLLTIDGYRYGGKPFDRSQVAEAVAAQLPGSLAVVRFGYLDGTGWPGAFIGPPDQSPPALTFTRVPFDHPLWVLYSSGTTGLPKPIVHGHGGILLEQLKMSYLHLDAQPGDRVFWFSTTGWMMWNFLVGVLLTDAEIVLYDGSPGFPDLNRLWQLADDVGITTFGTSAGFLSACHQAGIDPRAGRGLDRLEAIGSTGSPLSPEDFDWIYDRLGPDLWLFSTSGGTDVCTAFVGGVPTLPVYPGELQARALGAAVEAWDPSGRSVVGEVGELVITAPMPSMPVGFWSDPHGTRYRESYFEMFPGVWRHGDWIEITERGTAIIYGRSDSTINRGGVRMGTSEIYRSVLAVDGISDALVVDVPRDGTAGWMPLFVVTADGVDLDDALRAEIRRRIRTDCSPRHVPDDIVAIPEVPRTLSGKPLEVPVKRILMGQPVAEVVSRESLANPDALEPFLAMARSGGPSRQD